MNCENIKKGDCVEIFHESFVGKSKTRYTVTRVSKKTFQISDGRKYWKVDGKNVAYRPFVTDKVINIIAE